MPSGRFAPSPTGDLHLGNLRTALVAWLRARTTGGTFAVRMEDLDTATARRDLGARQLDQLRAIGVDWDGPIVWQSDRRHAYDAAIASLVEAGLTYPCYCSRREIREAAAAPHGALPGGAYPGTCRSLTPGQRAERQAAGRPPALRLRAEGAVVTFDDLVVGTVTGAVDDLVLRRNDGTPAYNLAVVVDDAWQAIDEVVRGDDLLDSTPRQVHLAGLLGLHVPRYAHVPLVLGPTGARLAKRDGAVTLDDLAVQGQDADAVRTRLAVSLGLARPGEVPTTADLLERFDLAQVPRSAWTVAAADL
ncbi:MAG: tRNA glutamyl-Q(34) synthetase GluQRS [Acidimicrobiales bacterium]|nr:tRNA glutamyl-Q(34) synthetase GluQRS [Acidimicrobiales bacterium]MCB1262478.1 tRNA glutamyl-Q(34) synthetase GluQRS [Acidimicrobiales bacterium]